MSPTYDRFRRAWPHLRAALIWLHIIAVIALTLPHPGIIVNRGRWNSARGRMELASWGKTFRKLGFELSDAELEERAWNIALAYRQWHRRYVGLLENYSTYLHTRQSWSMFTHPKKGVGKVWVEVGEPGNFHPVFVSKSPRYRWHEPELTHNRMRKLFNRLTSHRYKAGFREFAEWVAPQLAREFSASHCRVRIENYVTPSAAEVRKGVEPKSKFTRSLVLGLEEYR